MAAFIRCARFLLATRSAGRILPVLQSSSQSQVLTACTNKRVLPMITSCRFNQIASHSRTSEADKKAIALENSFRRYGRVARNQIDELMEALEKEGSVTSNQSLLLLRSLGSSLFDEHPSERTKLATQIWDKFQQLGVEYGTAHYNALLGIYLQNNHKFSPTDFLANMEANNVQPNRVTYQRLIAAYCKDGDIQGATQVLDHMKKLDLPINDQVFNSFITGHFRAGDPESAKEIPNIMRQAGLDPTGDTYCSLMCAYAEKGDIEAIKQTLTTAEVEAVVLTPSHLLDTLLTLAVNGHKEHVPEILAALKRGIGFNQDAIKYINQLVSQGHDDIAFQLFFSMTPPTRLDSQENAFGRFFLRALAKNERPVDKVAEVVAEMQKKQMNKDDLSSVAHLAYLIKKPDYALQVLEKMKEQGLPIRAHYFWPAFCQYRKEGSVDKFAVALQKMTQLCDTRAEFVQTLKDFVVPFLSEHSGEAPSLADKDQLVPAAEALRHQLMGYGFIEPEVNFSLFLILSDSYSRQAAMEFGKDKDMEFIFALYKFGALKGFPGKNPKEVLEHMKMCQDKCKGNFADGFCELVSEAVDSLLAHSSADSQEQTSDLLDYIDSLGLKIAPDHAGPLKSKAEAKGLDASVVEKIEKLVDPAAGKARAANQGQGRDFSNMSIQKLNEALDQGKGSEKGAQKWLLIKACAAGRVAEVEELKKSLDEEGFIYPPITLRQLAFMYAANGNVEQAKTYLQQLQSQYPEYQSYSRVVLKLASAMLKQNDQEGALKVLEDFSNQHRSFLNERGFDRNQDLVADCAEVVEAGARLDSDLGKRLLQDLPNLGFIRRNPIPLLDSFMDGLLQRGDGDAIVAGLEDMVKLYNRAPRIHNIFQTFIDKEDPERLQKAVDLVTGVHGGMNVLHHLLVTFVECGQLKKARKILETPGLRAIMPRLTYACDNLLADDKITELENLVTVTKDMADIDRDEMLFQLMRGYARQKDWAKTQGVLTMYEEENVQPRARTLRYLAKVLQNNKMEVPFEVPPLPPWEDSTPPPASGRTRARLSDNVQVQSQSLLESQKVREFLETKARFKDDKEWASHVASSVKKAISRGKTAGLPQLFAELADKGEVEALSAIEAGGVPEGKLDFALKKSFMFAYVNSGRVEEMLRLLEGRVEHLGSYFSHQVVTLLLANFPQHMDRVQALAEQAFEAGKFYPLNLVCMAYFSNGTKKWKEIIEKFPDLLPRLRVSDVCVRALENDQPTLLLGLVDMLRGHNPASQAFAYSYLLSYHCKHKDLEAAQAVLSNLQKDGHQLTDLRPRAVEKVEQLMQEKGVTIPWDVTTSKAKKPKKDDSSSSSSSSSSSTSSSSDSSDSDSDEEEKKKKKL